MRNRHIPPAPQPTAPRSIKAPFVWQIAKEFYEYSSYFPQLLETFLKYELK